VVFAAAALLLKTKKPGAGCLACPRLELSFDYSLLRRSPVNLRADLSIVPIIIVVVTKSMSSRKYGDTFPVGVTNRRNKGTFNVLLTLVVVFSKVFLRFSETKGEDVFLWE